MSLLREGDSVNFQKASCTLDGCVKIYTSRVDSVATETGRLLSGLADSNSRKSGGEDADGADEEEGEEEDGDGSKKTKKKRIQRSSEATLATSFSQLQLKKMDLEFSVDPLFKKATADFDEGGAKGLLLNHLTIDSRGRIVFDSSNDSQDTEKESTEHPHDDINEEANAQETTASEAQAELKSSSPIPESEVTDTSIDLNPLAERFFPDLSKLDELDICPSLKSYELGGASENIDIPFLKDDDWKQDRGSQKSSAVNEEPSKDALHALNDDNDGGSGLGGFDVVEDVGFGEGGEAWAKEAALETQTRPFDSGPSDANEYGEDDGGGRVGGYEADGAQYGVTLSAKDTDAENILSYFDQALHKNWAGPEHWRIRKIKDATKPAAPTRQRKEREAFEIDFSAPMSQQLADSLYTPATSNAAICLPRSQWRSKTRNLLPDDKHFNSRQLLRLFLKPKARIGARKPGSTFGGCEQKNEMAEGEMDGAFWARRAEEAAAEDAQGLPNGGPLQGDFDTNFFQDDGLDAPPGIDDEDDDVFADARETFSPGAEGLPGANEQVPGLDEMMASDSQQPQGAFGSQLVTQSRRVRPEYVQYARTAKKVDVRRLKEEIWKELGFERQEPPERQQEPIKASTPLVPGDDGSLKFTDAMNGLHGVYPQKAMDDISTSYCFICLLHLANEKGLVLQHEQNWEEIKIRRDETAEIVDGAE